MGKRLWLMRFGGDYQISVAKNLLAEASLEVLLCTVSDADRAFIQSEADRDCIILSNNEVCLVSPSQFSKHMETLEEALVTTAEDPYAFIAMQNLDRNERFSGELTFHDRSKLVAQQFAFWESVFDGHEPEIIVFADIPHMYYELVVISIAKRRAIPCVVVTDLFREGHVLLDSDFLPIKTEDALPLSDVIREKLLSISRYKTSDIDRVKKTEIGNLGLLRLLASSLKLLALGNAPYKLGYFISRTEEGHLTWPSSKDQAIQQARYVMDSLRSRLTYEKKARKFELRPGMEYAYFPLPSGFENIINPLASPFDLSDMIELAIQLLPEGRFLVIKEHPMQFKVRHSIRQRRNPEFYDWLEKEKRILLAPLEENHFKLIRNSKEVFALPSSSTFIESLVLGVEVTAFGRNKYKRSHLKVEKFSSLDDLDLSTARSGSIFMGSSTDAARFAESLVVFINGHLGLSKSEHNI